MGDTNEKSKDSFRAVRRDAVRFLLLRGNRFRRRNHTGVRFHGKEATYTPCPETRCRKEAVEAREDEADGEGREDRNHPALLSKGSKTIMTRGFPGKGWTYNGPGCHKGHKGKPGGKGGRGRPRKHRPPFYGRRLRAYKPKAKVEAAKRAEAIHRRKVYDARLRASKAKARRKLKAKAKAKKKRRNLRRKAKAKKE